jgi:hypothetical protein
MRSLIRSRLVLIVVMAILVTTCSLPASLAQETSIVVSNGKTRTIENIPAIMTGDVLVDKNSTLIMKNVVLQLSVRGEKCYNITVRDRSTLILRKSSIVSLNSGSNITIGTSSTLVIEDGSSITGFRSLGFENASLVSLQSTTLGVGFVVGSVSKLDLYRVSAPVTLMDVSCPTVSVDTMTLSNLYLNATQLTSKGLRVSNFDLRCSRASLSDIQASMLKIQATGQVYASGLRATTSSIYAQMNTTISDSVFGTLTLGQRGLLYNVVTSSSPLVRAGGMIYTYENSTVKRYWNLKLNVTDITMMPVPAIVEIRDYNMTLVDYAKVSPDGTISKPVLSEIIHNSVPTFMGNYKISARYKSFATNPETLVLDINKAISLVFPDEIPGLASVTLTVSPQSVLVGDKVSVRGKIRVPMKDNIVELTYVAPDGSKVTRAAITDKDGAFVDEVILDMPGKWRLQAYWVGGEIYSEGVASISRPMIFQAIAKQSVLSALMFMIPILAILVATIIGIAFVFLKRGGTSHLARPSKPKPGRRLEPLRQIKRVLRRKKDVMLS